MRKLLFVLIGVIMFSGLFATVPSPTTWDMAIPSRYDFTEEQIDSVLSMYRVTYESWLETPGLFSKGQTGLMILDLFALRDTLTDAAQFQGMIIDDQLYEIFNLLWYLEDSFYFITDNVNNQYDLIDNLYAFMTEGKADSIIMFKDSIEQHLSDTYDMTMENLDNTLWNMGMFADSISTRFDTVLSVDEDFIFRVGEVIIDYDGYGVPYLDTSEVAVIYDESYKTVWTAVNYLVQGVDYLGSGIEHILYSDSTMSVGLDTLAMAMQKFQHVADTLNNYSMWSFMDSTDLVNIENVFVEAEEIVNGKTYFINVWEDALVVDSVEIRPIGVVENIHHGLYRTFIDMYWQPDPYAYTFRNIFPSGLPHDVIDQLQPDMVINPMDSLSTIQTYFDRMEGVYREGLFFDSTNVDAHVGLGYIMTFNMLRDVGMQAETIAELVDGGRIDSLFQNYDWTNLDYTDEIDEIRYHLFKQVDAFEFQDTTVIYTILFKDPYMSSPGEEILEGDMVYPVYVIPQATEAVLMTSFMIENAINATANAIKYVYAQVDSMIDITLNPNLLNLSNIEEPLDLIYALEAANPNFGAFTPEGKMMFEALGDSLARGMLALGDFADTVMATVDYAGPLLGEFGMSPEDHDTLMMGLANVNYHIDMFAADLATPEAYTYMDDDTLNLSAWFDNVPDNLLAVFKDYFEGRDSSMAGMYPTKVVDPGVDPTFVPGEFALKGNYPNPFNPLTTIAFDLPSDGMVDMAVFNITGRKVATLLSQDMSAGSYELTWNAADYSSGVYIVRVQQGSDVAYQKMTLLK